MSKDVSLTRVYCSDWEGYYKGEELLLQGSSVATARLLEKLIGYTVQDVYMYELNEDWLWEEGGFLPNNLREVRLLNE